MRGALDWLALYRRAGGGHQPSAHPGSKRGAVHITERPGRGRNAAKAVTRARRAAPSKLQRAGGLGYRESKRGG